MKKQKYGILYLVIVPVIVLSRCTIIRMFRGWITTGGFINVRIYSFIR